MCGILGIFGNDDVARDLILGLNCIQHRGQDSAGIVTFENSFKTKKGLGLASNIFCERHVERLKAYCGLGHVRYSTIGTPDVLNAQPMAVDYPFGMAMVHNGNVTNFNELRKTLLEENHRLLETSNDVELILYTFASELEKRDLKNLSVDDIFKSVEETQRRVKGSYSAVCIIANKGFLAFTDPRGIRPIIMGEKKTPKGPVFAFVSESTCFDFLGFDTVRDIGPGEAVFIDMNRKIHTKKLICEKQAFCVFEYIYFAREDSVMNGKLVAGEREKMGRLLIGQLEKRGIKPDIVIDVPFSSYFFASSLAEGLGVPYKRAFAKNRFSKRSFILPDQIERERAVHQKINPIKPFIKGKMIAVVDDSIVRGTTSRHIVRLLREAGAEKIYFVSASPPIKHPCVYGIDMSIKTELIATTMPEDQIAEAIGADAVIYQSFDDLKELYRNCGLCYACFDGCYPTGLTSDDLKEIENERRDSHAA